jgi:hypothetical protein
MLRYIIILTLSLLSIGVVTAQEQYGLISKTDAAQDGYTLFSPQGHLSSYLIDNDGHVIQQWDSQYVPGNSLYLLDNGNLLRTGKIQSDIFTRGGIGGIVEEYTWDGELIWSFEYHNDQVHLHHDIEPLPNGNILMIAWEYISPDELLAAGRLPDLIPTESDNARPERPPNNGNNNNNRPNNNNPPTEDATEDAEIGLWADHLIEVDPTTNEIVWEWHVWDHIIQDTDANLPNYGNVTDNPQKVNLNYTGNRVTSDWNHINAVDYNPELDQILLSVHAFSEIWVIDHSMSTEDATGTAGDLLYRWGNPEVSGASGEQLLYAQHDVQWIPSGLSGAGNILIFNNGNQRTRPYSIVEEIAPPLHTDGTYDFSVSASRVWNYTAPNPTDFYSTNISGAQRLPNGNTLICSGRGGIFFEVAPDGTIVWEYVNPIGREGNGTFLNSVFRAERYMPDYSGFLGRDLTPGNLLG